MDFKKIVYNSNGINSLTQLRKYLLVISLRPRLRSRGSRIKSLGRYNMLFHTNILTKFKQIRFFPLDKVDYGTEDGLPSCWWFKRGIWLAMKSMQTGEARPARNASKIVLLKDPWPTYLRALGSLASPAHLPQL